MPGGASRRLGLRLVAGPAVSLLLVAACRSAAAVIEPIKPSGIAADVAYLASPALQGRASGTPGNDSAAVFLARRHRALGLAGAFPGLCPAGQTCGWSYYQYFTSPEIAGHNVGAFIRGSHATLYKEFIVVGAHYDHLGTSARFALDPDMQASARLGADDNASGTAAVLELARRLAASPPLRSVLLIHFDAEEHGLVGSRAFVQSPPIPASRIVFMLNLDMVGRLYGRDVLIDGSVADGATRALADSVARALRVPAVRSSASARRSDHATFASIGVPALALTSGFHADYHRVTDVVARIDVQGLTRIVDLAEGIVRAAAAHAWLPRQTSSIAW
ncbi:MAG TPA: M28 family peptidase [Gemmatimonadaceae bacterium]|nr:M28 family peptidase [Gemmatimonadaceae bacterium]